MAITGFTTMPIVCFMQAMEYGAVYLIMPGRLPTLTEDGCLCANEGALVPLLCKMRANVLKSKLLCIIDDCVVHPMAAFLAFARGLRD